MSCRVAASRDFATVYRRWYSVLSPSDVRAVLLSARDIRSLRFLSCHGEELRVLTLPYMYSSPLQSWLYNNGRGDKQAAALEHVDTGSSAQNCFLECFRELSLLCGEGTRGPRGGYEQNKKTYAFSFPSETICL